MPRQHAMTGPTLAKHNNVGLVVMAQRRLQTSPTRVCQPLGDKVGPVPSLPTSGKHCSSLYIDGIYSGAI